MPRDTMCPDGVLRTCRGMVNFFKYFRLVGIGFGFEVCLPLRGEFSQIVPPPDELSPLTQYRCGFLILYN